MISWIESVDPVADLCLTNQICSVLLNAFEFKEITEVQNASRRLRNASWPSFVKSRMLLLTFSTNLLYPCMYIRGES